jgi:hypothetical protein
MPVARGRTPDELSPAEEQPPAMPTRSLDQAAQANRNVSPEPDVHARDPARSAGVAAAAATFGAGAAAAAVASSAAQNQGGIRALVQYDYEKGEDNEIELHEGEYVTNIDMVDDDWWMGTNVAGESGLFPANYVEVVKDEEQEDDEQEATAGHSAPEESAAPPPPPPPQAGGSQGPTATAQFDYEAAEDNEISFPEGATITDVEFPDEDWWLGTYNGHSGLFPANYVTLDE